MVCRNCNEYLEQNDKYCEYCGTVVKKPIKRVFSDYFVIFLIQIAIVAIPLALMIFVEIDFFASLIESPVSILVVVIILLIFNFLITSSLLVGWVEKDILRLMYKSKGKTKAKRTTSNSYTGVDALTKPANYIRTSAQESQSQNRYKYDNPTNYQNYEQPKSTGGTKSLNTQFSYVVFEPNKQWEENIVIDKNCFSVGSSKECDLTINSENIQDEHLLIFVIKGEYFITNKSSDEVKLNNSLIRIDGTERLSNNDVVSFDRYSLLFKQT